MRLRRRTVELERRNPDRAHALLPALARLADALDEAGERAEALELSREAVPLIERLLPRKRQKYAAELAESLDVIAGRLRDHGHLEEAVRAQQEGIDIHEQLAPGDPLLDGTFLGMGMWDLAADQLKLGRNEDAVATSERAVGLWSRICTAHPTYEAGMGVSLSILAQSLGAAGHWERARIAAGDAVAVLRSQRGGPDLAEALTQLSAALAATGRPFEARAAAAEAVNVYRRHTELDASYQAKLDGALELLAMRTVS